MTDLIDRAKAIAELKREASCGDRDYEKGLEIAADILELFPSVDAVEVVRCRECKHLDTHNHRCKVWNHGVYVWFDFCGRAERKE